MERQIPLCIPPSRISAQLNIPPEKESMLTFGGALLSAGGEKKQIYIDNALMTMSLEHACIREQQCFLLRGNGKCMNLEKKCEHCAISISILFRCRRNAAWQLCKRACLVSPPRLSLPATNSIKNLIPISGSLAAKVINNFSAK
jgi:hypothetical protein